MAPGAYLSPAENNLGHNVVLQATSLRARDSALWHPLPGCNRTAFPEREKYQGGADEAAPS